MSVRSRPWLALVFVLLTTVIAFRIEGRRWRALRGAGNMDLGCLGVAYLSAPS